MKETKRKRLEAAGWKVGTAAEFLGLSQAEAELVEIKLSLATALRERREREDLTQLDVAERLGSSQSRVAKMEAGDRSVSIDLLVRSNLALGANRRDIARVMSGPARNKSRQQPARVSGSKRPT